MTGSIGASTLAAAPEPLDDHLAGLGERIRAVRGKHREHAGEELVLRGTEIAAAADLCAEWTDIFRAVRGSDAAARGVERHTIGRQRHDLKVTPAAELDN
jgi:hypothetical protein